MKKFLLIMTFLFVVSTLATAQDSTNRKDARKSKKAWRKEQKSFLLPGRPWTIEVPLWIPGFRGDFAYGDVELEGEDGTDPENPIEPPGGDLGEIISRLFQKDWYLKFFYLTRIAYEKNRFLVNFDGITGSVGGSVKFKYNQNEIVSAHFNTTEFRLIGGYKIVNAEARNKKFRYELFGYIGGRLFMQRVYSELQGIERELDVNPYWVDPVIGVQNQFSFKRWYFVLQGDYGGYFFQNNTSFQLSTYMYYRTGRITSLKFGWNHMYVNRKGNFLNEDYNINITLSGPSIALVFHF